MVLWQCPVCVVTIETLHGRIRQSVHICTCTHSPTVMLDTALHSPRTQLLECMITSLYCELPAQPAHLIR